MISVRISRLNDKIAWNKYVNEFPDSTFFHLFDWSFVVKKTYGHEPYYLLAEESGKIVGVLPLILIKGGFFGKYIVSLPFCDYGGPLSNNEEIETLLINESIRLYKKLGVDYLELRCNKDLQISSMKNKTDKVNLILNLNKDYQSIWDSFKPKVRNQIRKAIKNNLKFKVLKYDEHSLSNFYDVFSKNMKDLGTPVHSIDFFKSILNLFSDNIKFSQVNFNDQVIASAIVISFKNSIEVPFASSLRKYRSFCPNNLLYWETIKIGCQENKNKFIFGRSSWNKGTFNFKKQWGSKPHQLNYQYISKSKGPIQSSYKKKYEVSRMVWRKLPLQLTKLIGPYIIKNIP